MTPTPIPRRVFLPLADSPVLARSRPHAEDIDLAVRLAEQAAPDAATVGRLLAIDHEVAAERIAAAFDARTDLPVAVLALVVAHRPGLRQATARLKNFLFPDGTGACHTFARTMAALAHRPEAVDGEYLSSARFTDSAGAADPAVLQAVLSVLLKKDILSGPEDAALGTLLNARRTAGAPVAEFDLGGAAVRERTRRNRARVALAECRDQTIGEIAKHTGGLTLAAELWFNALLETADTPGHSGPALALAYTGGGVLEAGEEPAIPWPHVRARWAQVTTAARTAEAGAKLWEQAWELAATTSDGSVWDANQRGLVAGYDLLAQHVLTHYGDATPTPDWCWATDPGGRGLLHVVADHLTGHLGHSPLEHFDDALLATFIRALAKNRRDDIPGALHIDGLIAAVKAARSKAHVAARPTASRIGIVVPMRSEADRIPAPGSNHPIGQDALTAKVAQLAWLLEGSPDTRAEILLVDEDLDGASARAAAETCPYHPQIRVTIATRTEETSSKGGAVLWGLGQLLGAGHGVLAYTDLDLTYPLDQLGLHLAALDQPGVAAVIGSRRRADSHGYYPPAGPDPTVRLYQQAVRELLGLDVTDPQAGFKAFNADALRAALPKIADRRLSFDTELLATIAGSITEVGVAALHRYTEGHTGAPRDYDAMLHAVHEQALRHGLTTASRPTPVWDSIRTAGSLRAATERQSHSVHLIPGPR